MPVTIRELAETVVRLVDPGVAIEHISYEQAFTPGFEDIRSRIPDLTRRARNDRLSTALSTRGHRPRNPRVEAGCSLTGALYTTPLAKKVEPLRLTSS